MEYEQLAENEAEEKPFRKSIKILKDILQLSIPITLAQICQTLLSPIALMFCGHLDDTIKLDGAALAISVISCTILAPIAGLTTACDSLFSQTVRSKNKSLVGEYLQKVIIIGNVYLIPIVILFVFLDSFLMLLGQNDETSKVAREFALIFIPGAWSYTMYFILNKYLLSMDISRPSMIIIFTSIGFNILSHYILLFQFDLGIAGSAISLAASHTLSLILVLLYICISGCYKETWSGWSTNCFKDLGSTISLAVSGMLMVAIEFWAFELSVFLSGILGKTPLGAQSILLQLDTLFYQMPYSMQIACSIKVGQSLGAGDIATAKLVGWVTLAVTVVASIAPIILFIAIPRQFARIFTSLSSIVDLTARLLPLVATYSLFDGINCVFKGVLIGSGRQTIASVSMFVTYFTISIPIGVSLMFATTLRLAGYYIGLLINGVFLMVVLLIIVLLTNWEKEKDKAFERNKTTEIASKEESSIVSSSELNYKTLNEDSTVDEKP